MIIKSHIRGGYRAAAEYMKEQGKNEKTRLVEISDPSARDLDDAFQNMWVVACNTRTTKPLHHVSINPMKGEFLTDKQVLAIVERLEEVYGYKQFQHQRVIVEHIKDGRQHFHVIWNRVNLLTGRPVWPGHHWNKSRQVAREMEKKLGLKRPAPRRSKRRPKYRIRTYSPNRHSAYRRKVTRQNGSSIHKQGAIGKNGFRVPHTKGPTLQQTNRSVSYSQPPVKPFILPPIRPARRRKQSEEQNNDVVMLPYRSEWSIAELIAWALEHGRWDILAQFGIFPLGDPEP